MTLPNAPATLVVSIHVDGAASEPSTTVSHHAEASVDSLLRFFADHNVQATWNFADPAESPLAVRVRADDGDHEIALSARSSWAGSDVGRRHFSEELSRHSAAAQNAGYSLTTLSLGNGAAVQHPEVLVQHGITAVCQRAAAQPAKRTSRFFGLKASQQAEGDAPGDSQARPLRWGLWHVPAGCDLLNPSPRRTRQRIEGARGGLLQCQVEVSALLDRHGKPLRWLDAAFTCILDLRDAGRLRISTMALAVNTLRRRSAAPARSILHRQAA